MNTRHIVIFLTTLFVSGCLQTTLNLPPDKDKIEKIEAGTLENSVRIIAGKPDRIIKSKYGYRTYYYRESMSADCKQDLQTCIPIIIERGRVAAVGKQWARAWEQQRHKKGAPPADEETTEEKIARLEQQVRTIPMSRTVDNLHIYRYLLKLDPDNKRYQQKVAFYAERFEKEKAKKVATKKQLAATRKWQNTRLQKFEGEPPAQMAIKILGNGKFHVWLKNTGDKAFRVEARQFFLSCEKGKRYTIYRSKDFGRDVAPSKVIEGRVSFATSCEPREFIYLNPGIAKLYRTIPIPEVQPETTSKGSPPTAGATN
jgi:hypothetical protein